jgi:hypothetical protein
LDAVGTCSDVLVLASRLKATTNLVITNRSPLGFASSSCPFALTIAFGQKDCQGYFGMVSTLKKKVEIDSWHELIRENRAISWF